MKSKVLAFTATFALLLAQASHAATVSAAYELSGGPALQTIADQPLVSGFDAIFTGGGNNIMRINFTNGLDRLEIDFGPALGGSDLSGNDLTGPWDFDVDGDLLTITLTNLIVTSITGPEPWTGAGNPQPTRITPSAPSLNTTESLLNGGTVIQIDWPVGFANANSRISYDIEATVVPLPAAAWFLGSALLGLLGFSRRTQLAGS